MSGNITEKIEKALQNVRPYLVADGGDVEFVSFNEDGIVEVRLTGACVGCPMSLMTLRAGIERALMRDIPEIKRVEAVE